MCRILVASGLDEKNKELNWQFIQEMAARMSVVNDDGLGYTAIDKDGNMFGERWLNNDDAFDVRGEVKEKPKTLKDEFLEKYKDFLNIPYSYTSPVAKPSAYNSFGTLTDEIKAITLHARMATSGKEFANTHPFVDFDRDTSLIHNGVIRNVTKEDNIRSTCDSERILNMYLKHNINVEPDKIQDMIDELEGYFACGVFTKDANNKRVLDVFKSRAKLYAGYVEGLGMFITTNDDDLKNVCKDLGLRLVGLFEVTEDRHIRFDALTGERISVRSYRDTANQVKSTVTDFQRRSLPQHSTAHGSSNSQTAQSPEASHEERASKLNMDDAKLDGWEYNFQTFTWSRVG